MDHPVMLTNPARYHARCCFCDDTCVMVARVDGLDPEHGEYQPRKYSYEPERFTPGYCYGRERSQK